MPFSDAMSQEYRASVKISRTWRRAHVEVCYIVVADKVLLKVSWSLLPILVLTSRYLR